MIGRVLAERLEAAGLDPVEVPAKAKLYTSVLAAFHDLTAARPDHSYWVPGRLEVFGTHTDYAGGRTIVSALPRGFAFAGRRREDGRLRVVDAITGETLTLDTHQLVRQTRWRNYVAVVAERLARNFPEAPLGADIVFGSDLPRAAGMSSSSALMVGLATMLVRVSAIRTRAEWNASIRRPLDEAGYYACIENGRTFAGLGGEIGVGTHGGSEDHTAMVCGQPGVVSAYAFLPMKHLDSAGLPDDWHIVVASSGVAAEKTGAALESYNRLARGGAVLLELWNRHVEPAGSLASALASHPDAERRLLTLIGQSSIQGWPRQALEDRLQHFVREDARIPEAMQAFRAGDAAAVAALAAGSQHDAEQLLQNQVDQTVRLTRLASAGGAFAARSFGAGFGGSVWAIVAGQVVRADEFASRWLHDYRAAQPDKTGVAFIATPGPGVVELIEGGQLQE